MNAKEQYAFVDSRYRKYRGGVREQIKAEDAGQPAPAVYTYENFCADCISIPSRILFAVMKNLDAPRIYPPISGRIQVKATMKHLKAIGWAGLA